MSKVQTESAGVHLPEVLRFKAKLVEEPANGKTASTLLLQVPKAASEKLRGMDKVEGTINGHPFRSALEERAPGLWLKVSDSMLRGSEAGVGDAVALAILGPEGEPVPPADLKIALASSPGAQAVWDKLTDCNKRDWIRWIILAKQEATRARRVLRTIDQLAEGKRRACCVDVNEFMMCRIRETEPA